MKGDQFEQIFYNGGTEWNEEVETNLETGETTNNLKQDAGNVKRFYESHGQAAHVEWPGNLPNFNLDKCEINTAMCCWPQDRQANDGNGNCVTPYDQNCYDKDPADNTDLCYVDLSRSPESNKLNSTGHVNFPFDNDNGEGAIHCHGFAWANDDSDFTSRFKANNLFFVSMYDHMHQRGYVRNIPGAPMCACVEQMPTVTRSDCTQIDVDEKYKIVHYPNTNKFTAELTDIEIFFNPCQGRYNRNNDLHAYVARLVQEKKLTNDQRAALDKYIVGNFNHKCDEVLQYEMSEKGYARGFNHDDNTWFKVAGSDSLHREPIGREAFRDMLSDSSDDEQYIVWRVCATCFTSHQNIYYKRLTPIPPEMNLLEMLLNDWTNVNNTENIDFKIYSTFEDAVNDKNPWEFYDFRGDRGFPYESGPHGTVRDQWRTFQRGWGRMDVAFYVINNTQAANRVAPLSAGSMTSLVIGNPVLKGEVLEKDGTYYITAGGKYIWSYDDEFRFLQEPISAEGDMEVKVYISSLQERHTMTQSGIMIRESLDANAAHFYCQLTGGQGVYATKRDTKAAYIRVISTKPTPISSTWLKIEKIMDTYNCAMSSDGEIWDQVGSSVMTGIKSDTLHVGMALTSRNRYYIAESVFEEYEMQASFYPSASPSVSRSPTYKYYLDGITTLKNVYSSRLMYASTNKSGESGVGAETVSTYVHGIYKWSIVPTTVECDNNRACYIIKNEDSKRCLYAEKDLDWQEGVGAGSCDNDNTKWYLEEACDGGCFFIINAESERRLYAQQDARYEYGVGAVIGNHCDDQKWYIELTA